jgi:hypothetical protein
MKVSTLITLLAALVAPTVHADYWVSVGSFQNRDNAESGLREAQSRSNEAFVVIASETANGFFYRIAAGPYASTAQAKGPLQGLRDNGYGSAWIWQGQSTQNVSPFKSPSRLKNTAGALNTDVTTQDDDLFADDDFLDEDFDYLFADTERTRPDEVISDLPKKLAPAPANYQLNKLRRD